MSNSSPSLISLDEISAINHRWNRITTQLEQHRVTDNIVLVAVSKTKPARMIANLAQQGQKDFGENYLQEALPKIHELQSMVGCEHIVWHYIGHVQRNKTRDIAENFAWVQTVERDIIAKRLNAQRPEKLPNLNILIQVNIDNESSKSGCAVDEVLPLVANIKKYDRLTLRGLMVLPSKAGSVDAFARTKRLFEMVADQHADLTQWDTLSMGMSDDMTDAIQHGSTMVRIGSAIFGARD